MKKLIAIMGTNASGKSALGLYLAPLFNGEIVSADSRQVYKGLDLGSGKVTAEEQQICKHHLLDVVEPNQPYSVFQFQQQAYQAIEDITSRNKTPFLVGGTGLYVRAVTDGYNFSTDTASGEIIEQVQAKSFEEIKDEILKLQPNIDFDFSNTPKRRIEKMLIKLLTNQPLKTENTPRYKVLKLGLSWDKEVLHEQIMKRLNMRETQGMIDEVKGLLANGATPEFLIGLGLEYRHIYYYISGKYKTYEEYRDNLYREICRFAKRQMTWFRKEKDIIWLDEKGDYKAQAKQLIEQFLSD